MPLSVKKSFHDKTTCASKLHTDQHAQMLTYSLRNKKHIYVNSFIIIIIILLLFLFSDPIQYDTDFVRTVHFVGTCLK